MRISDISDRPEIEPGIFSSKLTLDITRYYFELPNYENDQVSGSLIEEDPFDNSTETQFLEERKLTTRGLINDTAWTTLNATEDLIDVGNKGPLLSIAMALFGEGSFADVQHATLAAYANSGINYFDCHVLHFAYRHGDLVRELYSRSYCCKPVLVHLMVEKARAVQGRALSTVVSPLYTISTAVAHLEADAGHGSGISHNCDPYALPGADLSYLGSHQFTVSTISWMPLRSVIKTENGSEVQQAVLPVLKRTV